jgi:chemotaxis signal transduction protein
VIGYITFRLAQRELACRLSDVREVVRLHELQTMPGLAAPVSGLLELRGTPLPVIDLRFAGGAPPATAARKKPRSARAKSVEVPATMRGDVLVLTAEVDAVGVAVDAVTGVLDDSELEPSGEAPVTGLPSYVVEIMRRPGDPAPVLLVDLRRLIKVAAA